MKKRILGGAIVLIVLITSILLGDIPFAITISLVALLGLKELIDIKYKNKDIKAIKILSSLSMLLILLNNTLYTLDIKVLIYLPILILIGGMLIGRKHFTTISPKKTIEGSLIGALTGSFIGSMYYIMFINDLSIIKIIILSIILTILSELGDLVFSSIKRYFGKKDYSNLIPGHGGILDRIDSIIFISPFAYFLLSLL